MTDSTADRGRDAELHWTELTARVVEYDDEPDECTIYPKDVSPGGALTVWLTARGDSFVELESMR